MSPPSSSTSDRLTLETTPPSKPQREIHDVWSRTEPRYRTRAHLLLYLNLLLFCALCVFTHWLHVARPFDFRLESYLSPAQLWGDSTQNLNDFVLYPINVVRTTKHAVVLGLLVAAIVSVPIVIAILFRFVWSLPFVAAVLIFAHMPWMALTLLGSCVLASVRPFRLRFRFGAALVGLIPVLIYLYLATRSTPEQLAAYAAPTQRTLLALPWLLAILFACVMLGLILLISWIVNYRPGAVAPVLGLSFALPMLLFYRQVGADELYYRVLEATHGPRSTLYEPVRAADDAQLHARSVSDTVAQDWTGSRAHDQWRELTIGLLAQRAETFDACKNFLSDFPSSRYVQSALYIQARALDTRIDQRRLADANPTRELYSEFPHPQSEESWSALWAARRQSALELVAGVRLAQLALRRGAFERAASLLEETLQRGNAVISASRPRQVDLPEPPEESLRVEAGPPLREAARLLTLVRENGDDPRFGREPLRRAASLDPHRAGYPAALERLSNRFPDSLLADNLELWRINLIENADVRAAALQDFLHSHSSGDARIEALLRLAVLECQALTGDPETSRARGVERLREVLAQHGESCWADEAAELLGRLVPRVAGRAGP